jgi:regulation of enolase protein 1 (concanavalin A-like superfamily)
MPRLRHALLLPAIGCLLVASSVAREKSGRLIEGWGEVVDPSGDCKFRGDGGKLTITVPGTHHDLSVEADNMAAPRVLREVEGDFVARLKVGGDVRHKGERTSDRYLAYHGAGLLLMKDLSTYIRLERAYVVGEDGDVHYANFELRKDGARADSRERMIPDRATYLRLERRDNLIHGAMSEDGDKWDEFDPIEVELPAKLKLGVAAINTSTEPFEAVLEGLKVGKPEGAKP